MEFMDAFSGAASRVHLSEVDFDWVAKCQSSTQLQSAVQQLEKEYFPDLLAAAKQRLREIDPEFADEASRLRREAETKSQAKSELLSMLNDCTIQEKVLETEIKTKNLNKSLASATNTAGTGVDAGSGPLTLAEHRLLCQQYKLKGNECYRATEFTQALEHYQRALTHKQQSRAADMDTDTTLETNIAITNIKLKKYSEAKSVCDSAINAHAGANTWKAYWRRGQSLEGLLLQHEALADYDRAIADCPANKRDDVAKDRKRCEKKWRECAGSDARKSSSINLVKTVKFADESKRAAPEQKAAEKPNTKKVHKMKIVECDDDNDDDNSASSRSATSSRSVRAEESKEQVSSSRSQPKFQTRSGFTVEVMDD